MILILSNHLSFFLSFLPFPDLNKGSLVLSVMNETPYRMLGRLIFEKDIPPKKLESMMGDFPHLPIVAVLTKCCCPDVSSHGLPWKTGMYVHMYCMYRVACCVCFSCTMDILSVSQF